MQAIFDYEVENGIPHGYIGFAISRASPSGAWQKLERSEIGVDEAFFRAFKSDLKDASVWKEFHDLRIQVPSEKDSANFSAPGSTIVTEPPSLPPVPDVEAEELFWAMMAASTRPDPYVSVALHKVRASGHFVLAALSNTIILPDNDPRSTNLTEANKQLWDLFDLVISSANVRMRKPEPRIYHYTMQRLQEIVGSDLTSNQIIFLDDIGENLKAAKAAGMRTIKVWLGKTQQAVQELQDIIDMDLLDSSISTSKRSETAKL